MAPFALKGCARSVHLGAQMQLQGGKRNSLVVVAVLRKFKTWCSKIVKTPGYANVSKKSSKLRPPSKGVLNVQNHHAERAQKLSISEDSWKRLFLVWFRIFGVPGVSFAPDNGCILKF